MMYQSLRRVVLGAAVGLLWAGTGFGQEISVTASKPEGVYAEGEKIAWRVEVKGEGAEAVKSAKYQLKKGALNVTREGTLDLSSGSATVDADLSEPGTEMVEITAEVPVKKTDGDVGAAATPEKKMIKGLGGAVMAPEKIKPSSPRPADFDAFWQAKFEELAAVPVNPKLEKVEIPNAKVDYFKITMDNIRGSHIQGQLARPKEGEKLPAMLVVQWAGVYGLDKNWILGRAQEGWLVLNIEAHDLPIDQPAQFYRDQDAGALKNYPSIGNDDRETSYFLRMYLSCYRAADYLAHREDWNGKVLVVTGGSQGGLQAIVTGAIHPKISAVVANVPAGCDMLGPDAGRAPGWPMWYWQVGKKDAKKVHEASRYFDVVNFASQVKCPTLVGLGLIDTTCPAAGVFSAVNAMTCPKQVVVMPKSGHQDQNGTQRAYNEASGIFINHAKDGDFSLPVKP